MKFAYLIMAHDNPQQLMLLLRLLDYESNDIYLHIDKKSQLINAPQLAHTVSYANLHIFKKFEVEWAGLSQTECQMFLLSEAVKTFHDYYHLLSGHDLPIKSNNEIQNFFKRNNGKEFIHFESTQYCRKEACRYYHFGNGLASKLLLFLQKVLNIQRKLYCGANWYSITHELALDFCKQTKYLINQVKWTRSSDEYILQTFFKGTPPGRYTLFKETLDPYDYSGVARLIDWKRGQPYVWREADFEEIRLSDRMFGRKFDEKIDSKVISMIEEYVNEKIYS